MIIRCLRCLRRPQILGLHCWQVAQSEETTRLRTLFARGLRQVSDALEASLQPAAAANRATHAAESSGAALTQKQAACDIAMRELLVRALLLRAPAYRPCMLPSVALSVHLALDQDSFGIGMTGVTQHIQH